MNRILQISNLDDARKELKKIGVSTGGIEVMAPKARVLAVKLHKVKLGAANILKQEMLSLGGDAAVAKGVVEGRIPLSDVILLGSSSRIRRLIGKLEHQSIFGLSEIKDDLKKLLNFSEPHSRILKIKNRTIDLGTVKIMGILNVTPDSFSDGAEYLDADAALEKALEMIEQGADIIDIGGESTRPGANKVTVSEEMERVIPVIRKLRAVSDIPVSVDTYKSTVAKAALESGADLINDVSALRFDNDMIGVLQEHPYVPVILMHMQGEPGNMQENPHYDDVIPDILSFLKERIEHCTAAGISEERILIDPGIGFGKRQEDNLQILQKLSEFQCLGRPLVLGASRKSFIGRIYQSDSSERLAGSLAAAAQGVKQGAAIIRVHDVLEHNRFIKTLQEIG
jgi:dihydropteroate synthase